MRTPDFLVVGAARSGTTSLHSYLSQHDEIYLPGLKEPCFFAFDGDKKKFANGKFAFAVRDFEGYERLFEHAGSDQKIGEMSTPYLYLYEKSIATMKKYFTDYAGIKIVIMLRNPADRAFSQYMWRVRDGREPLSFEEAVQAEKDRMCHNFSFDYFYVDRGFYFKQVKAYMENFKNVHVILFDDFISKPENILKELCTFLGVGADFDFKAVNSQNDSIAPKSKWLARAMTFESRNKYRIWYALPDGFRKSVRRAFSKMNESKKNVPVIDNSTHKKLVELYSEDILALQNLIHRDLSLWLK